MPSPSEILASTPLSNADMTEVWTLTRNGVPIDILP